MHVSSKEQKPRQKRGLIFGSFYERDLNRLKFFTPRRKLKHLA